MFQVESNIPVVASARGRKPTAFPLDQMEIGDSFLIPCNVGEKKELDSWRRKLLVARKRFAADWSFKTAIVEDGLRVWRTA